MTSNQINVLGQAKTRFICLFALNADKCLWHPYEQPLKSRPVCGIKLGSWGSHVTPLALNCWIVFVIDYATHFYAGPQYVLAQYLLSACLVINWYFMEAFNLLSIVVRRPWHKSRKIVISNKLPATKCYRKDKWNICYEFRIVPLLLFEFLDWNNLLLLFVFFNLYYAYSCLI